MDERLRDLLRNALVVGEERGVTRPRISDLSLIDRENLAGSTLVFLASRRHSPSPYPGWIQVRGFDAGVLRWWNDHLGGPFPSSTTARLQTLRRDIYDFLDDLGRIVKEPGQSSPVHLAPSGDARDDLVEDLDQRTIQVSSSGAGFGDAETNRLVEAAAMRAAVAQYIGWEHADVSQQNCGWDITFRRGHDERHVEVKGVSGQRPKVVLTRNEIAAARTDPLWSLLVVTRALVSPAVQEFAGVIVLDAVEPYIYLADLM